MSRTLILFTNKSRYNSRNVVCLVEEKAFIQKLTMVAIHRAGRKFPGFVESRISESQQRFANIAKQIEEAEWQLI